MVDTNCRELIFFPEPCLKCIEKGNFGRVPIAAKESGTKSLHHLFSSIPHHSGLIDNWKNIAKTLCNRKILFGSTRSYSLKIWEDFHFLGAKKFITHSRSLSVKAVVLYWAYDQALISITKKNPLFVPLVQNFMLLYREGEQNSNELQTILHILKRDIISCFLVKFRNSTVRLGYFILWFFFLGKKINSIIMHQHNLPKIKRRKINIFNFH